jgi:NAD(P)-dependent dehydrogenase (short-subunit alcohol dehydrogenase family)
MGDRMKDKVVLVTGGGRGFGAVIARAVAEEGANVAVHHHSSAAGAEAVVREIRNLGRHAISIQGDIAKWDDVKRVVAGAYDEFGRVDVLINNVGDVASGQMSWRDITEESIDHILAVDIKGTMLMTHECGLRMVEAKSGIVLNIGSHVVINGSPRAPQYAAAKYGIIGLTKSYAAALGPYVRVNTLGPGFIETERTVNREDWKSGRREAYIQRTLLKHVPKPEEIVGSVLFLASEESSHVTGAFLVCNGGYSMIGA